MLNIFKISSKILIVFFIIINTACTNKIEEINAFKAKESYPDITIYNFETTYSSEALIRFKLKAPLLLMFSNSTEPYYECPKGVYVITYDLQMNVKSTLKSDYAIYYENKKLAKVEKNVVLTNNIGDMLQAEYLFLD